MRNKWVREDDRLWSLSVGDEFILNLISHEDPVPFPWEWHIDDHGMLTRYLDYKGSDPKTAMAKAELACRDRFIALADSITKKRGG